MPVQFANKALQPRWTWILSNCRSVIIRIASQKEAHPLSLGATCSEPVNDYEQSTARVKRIQPNDNRMEPQLSTSSTRSCNVVRPGRSMPFTLQSTIGRSKNLYGLIWQAVATCERPRLTSFPNGQFFHKLLQKLSDSLASFLHWRLLLRSLRLLKAGSMDFYFADQPV